MEERLLKQYSELKHELKRLTDQEKLLKQALLETFKEQNIDKLESPAYGTFTIVKKPSWEYSDAVAKLEEKVELAKIKEKDKGIAKETFSEYVLFTPIK